MLGDRVTGVVLAGGLSRRMGGGDKCLRPLAGRAMLSHVIDRIGPQCDDVILNANGDPRRFHDFGVPVVADTVAGFVGPLAGVLAGMRWARLRNPQMRWIVTVSADAPFLPNDLVAVLRNALKDARGAQGQIALARSQGGLHPVIGLWPTALADDLEQALAAGVRKVLAWTDRHGTVAADFAQLDVGGRSIDPFFNVNTPQELAEAEAIVCEGPT